MIGLILAGGKGTRLRPLTLYTPKPVVPVMNRPFLLYQIDALRAAGIDDIILSLNYQPDKIEHLVCSGSGLDAPLKFLTEPNPLGTAGAFRYATEGLDDTTIVLNGDILTNADLRKVIRHHRRCSAEATIVLTPVDDPARYGLVRAEKNTKVKDFIEKPGTASICPVGVNTINAGVYVLEPSVRDLICTDRACSFEYDVFPKLIEQGRRFFSYTLRGEYWRDLGTPESYLAAHMDFLDGKINVRALSRIKQTCTGALPNVDANSMIGDGCVIKPNARIINSVLGPGTQVEERAVIENSVIWSHTRVSSFAEIRSSVIARSCHIGRNVRINAGNVIGDKASIPDYSQI